MVGDKNSTAGEIAVATIMLVGVGESIDTVGFGDGDKEGESEGERVGDVRGKVEEFGTDKMGVAFITGVIETETDRAGSEVAITIVGVATGMPIFAGVGKGEGLIGNDVGVGLGTLAAICFGFVTVFAI